MSRKRRCRPTQLGPAILEEVADHGQAQFIIASHSPILLSCPGQPFLDGPTIAPIAYDDTAHYSVYKVHGGEVSRCGGR